VLAPIREERRSYEFNLALLGMALTLLIVGTGAYSLDGALGVFW